MTPLITRYALDPTGVSANNLVSGELHTMVRRRVRAIATEYGAFFTQSLRIVDTATQQQLVAGQQFYAAEMYELPSARYGKEICAIIIITDPTVGDEVSLTYQALGGEFSNSMTAIINQLEQLNLDDRAVNWGNLVDKPSEYPASHHLHDIGDVYGFEYLVHSVDRVRSAIIMGDDISHDVIYKYVDLADNEIKASLAQTTAAMNAHMADMANPHHVTPTQLNVYTKPESDAALAAVNTALSTSLSNHLNDHNNPHQVTPTQLNVYTKPETDTIVNTAKTQLNATITAHTSRTDNPHQVTAAQLNVYLKTQTDTLLANLQTTLTNLITAHTSRTDNPHNTTAAQVGAYTKAETDSKDSAVATTAATNLSAHTSRVDNPHATTAAQVGAYTKSQTDSLLSTQYMQLNNAITAETSARIAADNSLQSTLTTLINNTAATLTTQINTAATTANWTGIAGFTGTGGQNVQQLSSFPAAGFSANVRPSYFYVSTSSGATSMTPTQFYAGSLSGFDFYDSTDLGSYQVGVTMMGGLGTGLGGSRGFQLMASWNFEELAPKGGLRYRVNDDTGTVSAWGALTTLWDSGNLTKLSQLTNDLNISGAQGGGTDKIFYENDQTVTANYTITSGKNAMTAGPIAIADGVTVTIPSGSTWTIV